MRDLEVSHVISAILLAAGESRRMGTFKQLLDFEGKTFVERCVDELLASKANEVIVVTGHRDDDVRRTIGEREVRFAYNAEYRSGMAGSILCGLSAVAPGTEAVLISLADQPQITAHVIDQVVDAYLTQRPSIVVPRYSGRKGHPIIIDLKLKDEVFKMDPAEGLRRIVRRYSGETVYVEAATDAILTDFDYPEDYSALKRA